MSSMWVSSSVNNPGYRPYRVFFSPICLYDGVISINNQYHCGKIIWLHEDYYTEIHCKVRKKMYWDNNSHLNSRTSSTSYLQIVMVAEKKSMAYILFETNKSTHMLQNRILASCRFFRIGSYVTNLDVTLCHLFFATFFCIISSRSFLCMRKSDQ